MQNNLDAKRHSSRGLPLWLLAALGASLISWAAAAAYRRAHPPVDLIQWQGPSAISGAGKMAQRWVLYDFTAAWCGPCKRLDKVFFQVPMNAAWINALLLPVRVTDRKQEDGANSPEVEALQKKYK